MNKPSRDYLSRIAIQHGSILVFTLVLLNFRDDFIDWHFLTDTPLHTFFEIFNVVIYASVFIVGWNAFGQQRNRLNLILSICFFCVAWFSIWHTISMKGLMNSGFEDLSYTYWYWIVSRFFAVLGLFLFCLPQNQKPYPEDRANLFFSLTVLSVIIVTTFVALFPTILPQIFVQNKPTKLFIVLQSILVFCFIVTAFRLYRLVSAGVLDYHHSSLHINPCSLINAALLMAISEIYFIIFDVDEDFFQIISHFFQLFAAIAIYRSAVASNIHMPYSQLEQTSLDLSQSLKQLEEQKKRLHGMIDTAIDGIITIDGNHQIVLVNPAAATIFGYTVNELLGKTINTLIPPRHHAEHESHVKSFGNSGTTRREMGVNLEDFYVTGIRRNGEEFPIEASISHQLEDGQRYYTVIFRDITERKIAREQSINYQRELTELSAKLQIIREEERKHIARELHDDLGQVLAALRMDLTLLQRDRDLDDKQHKTVASMDQLLLNAITTLRRIATDLRPRALDEGGLYFALQTLVKDFSLRHQIDCELSANEAMLALDDAVSTAIFRIVQESLTNVARHSGASEVQIHFWREDENINFKVTDNGKGLHQDESRKIQSFGLVGMRERVKALRGEFSINSDDGEGTQLSISLPIS